MRDPNQPWMKGAHLALRPAQDLRSYNFDLNVTMRRFQGNSNLEESRTLQSEKQCGLSASRKNELSNGGVRNPG